MHHMRRKPMGTVLGQYFTSNVVIETGQLREEVPEAL